MPTCPACNHENAVEVDVCAQCSAPLGKLRAGEDDNTPHIRPPLLEPKVSVSRHPSSENRSWIPGSLALFIENAAEPVITPLKQQVFLGRHSVDTTVLLGVDLGPYEGVERGISRTHAVIRRSGDGLTIQDLASTNGTWLNKERLPPFLPKPLKPGDHVRLGLLEMTLYFEV
jgi:pSer/pThr/pTyr-binding forkhead associated (FHA) protein